MNKKVKILLILLVSLIGLRILIEVPTYARYAGSAVWNYYLESKGFYFDSSTLAKDNVNTNWDGGSVHFDVKNSQSSLLASGYDINYKVTCNIKNNINASCLLNNTNSNTFTGRLSSYEECVDLKGKDNVRNLDFNTCVNRGYEYRNQETKMDMYFDIVSDEEIKSAEVEIVLESTYPYKKTIKGDFILNKGLNDLGNMGIIYNEYEDYSRVIVNNSFNENKCVKLSFDTRDFKIESNNIENYTDDESGYIKDIKFNIDTNSYKDFIFYRVNKENSYSNENFSVIEDNEC